LYLLGTDLLKDAVAAMMDRDNAGAGYLHTPSWLGRWWYDELTYEIRDPASGKWRKPGKRPNEAFDLCVYNLALFILLKGERIDWSSPPPWAAEWDENLLISQSPDAAPAVTQPKPPAARKRRRVVKSRL
ncbi:terminase gpA endonuclease subunit, partial [Cobetia sp.]